MNSREIGCPDDGGCTPVVGFDGAYAPANWAFEQNFNGNIGDWSGSVDVSDAPDSITVEGMNESSGGWGSVTYLITVLEDGVVSFDWEYDDTETSGPTDPAGLMLNGTPTQYNYGDVETLNGSDSVAVVAGDTIGWYVYSIYNYDRGAQLKISNFNFACPPAS